MSIKSIFEKAEGGIESLLEKLKLKQPEIQSAFAEAATLAAETSAALVIAGNPGAANAAGKVEGALAVGTALVGNLANAHGIAAAIDAAGTAATSLNASEGIGAAEQAQIAATVAKVQQIGAIVQSAVTPVS